jgi:hypothetical protein
MSCGAGHSARVSGPSPRLLPPSSSHFYSPGAALCEQGAKSKNGSSSILERTSPVILPPFALMHANIRQTMDTYSHVLPNIQQQAAERLDEMLG